MKKVSRLDKVLLALIILFSIFGLIMVLSASSMESYMRYDKSPYTYFIKQLLFVGVGYVVYFILHLLPTSIYKKLSSLLMFLIITAMIGLLIYGNSTRKVVSWFQIGPIKIQPSEFAKLISIIYLSSYYGKHKNELNDYWIIMKPLIPVLIVCILVALQPDLGTACIIALISFLIFLAAPIESEQRKKINKIMIALVGVVLLLFITTKGKILKDYQLQRLFSFLSNPCENYQSEEGYQLCNSYIAFHNGSLKGNGIGGSTQKYLYLPDSYTDFIFPIIIEEWGLVIGIVIIVCYIILLYRIFKLSKKSKKVSNNLMAFGIFSYIAVHIIVNLGGVMGLLPLTGVPLPFLSYGGSFTLTLFASLGIIQRISIENAKERKGVIKR